MIDTGLTSYTTAWCGGAVRSEPAVNGVQTGGWGISFIAPLGVAGDTFSVQVTNDNENPWDFAIAVEWSGRTIPLRFQSIPRQCYRLLSQRAELIRLL